MVELDNLTKKFDSFTAVDHLSFTINTGDFFGLLGPNGAGKTTTISMLSTLLLPTEGEVRIDGIPLTRHSSDLKSQISVITQEYSLRQDMTMDEIMEYQGRLYKMNHKEIKAKTEELLDFCGLIKYRKRTVRKLSGGMKRKLMVCRALLTDPKILLLDEPTAGMDAMSRRQMWALLKKLNNQNMTILLTTHYMEEAENLCNRIALLDHGHLSCIGTPTDMISSLGKYAVLPSDADDDLSRHKFFQNKEDALSYIAACEEDLLLRGTSLEDVFLHSYGSRD